MDHEIMRLVRAVFERLQEHDRRIAGVEFKGKCTHVDAAKQIFRMEIGKDEDGNPVLSPWLPYKQTAGALKFHNPPSVGQPMVIRTETGDIEQGTGEPFRWNDENPSPDDDGEKHVATFGDFKATLTKRSLRLEMGGTNIYLTGGGVRVNGRLHTTRGVHDEGGVYSKVGTFPRTFAWVPEVSNG